MGRAPLSATYTPGIDVEIHVEACRIEIDLEVQREKCGPGIDLEV